MAAGTGPPRPALLHTGRVTYPGYGPQWQPPPPHWQPPPPQWQPPVDPAASDTAYRWFKVYAGVMTAIYAAVVALGIFFAAVDVDGASGDVVEQRVSAAIYAFAGLIGAGVHAVGLFLPRKPWAWIYGIVLLSLGLTSCCLWPATIPLLIWWLKPEMKARFHRS